LGDGALYVIDSDDSCPTGYTALDWNKTGPAGVSGYEMVTDAVTVPANTVRADVTVNCPTGKVALGGGGSSETLEMSKPVVASGNAVGWEAQGRRADPNSGNPLTATVWAICATVAL
jgi:hypothetical protein